MLHLELQIIHVTFTKSRKILNFHYHEGDLTLVVNTFGFISHTFEQICTGQLSETGLQ